ncbi:hypothetical protein AB0469_37955 [Streptomyces sp. NPDC093801]|uniref:hypothetical protein n=1 Tax=Streptomyces sp. NPDC093801 TaxID=3155203 RepID=UPI00344F463D
MTSLGPDWVLPLAGAMLALAGQVYVLTDVLEAGERTTPHYPVMSEEQIEILGKDWAHMETWPVGSRTAVLLSGYGL